MDADETLLTVADVAARLKVSHESVRRMCRSQKLAAVKIGANFRITEDAYRAIITPPAAPQKPRTQRKNIERLLRSA